jgi:heat shock protein HslJ
MKQSLSLIILLTFVLAACASPQSAPAPVVAQPTAANTPTLAVVSNTPAELADILGNLSYSGLFPDQQIALTDGYAEYEEEGPGHPFVRLIDHLIATGDLDGDGVEDAVALLEDDSTGSGDFVYLAAVLNVWAEPTPLKAIMLGDRSPVKSLTIAGTQVIAELIAQGPGDPACCSTWNVRKNFNIEGGQLVEGSSVELNKASLNDLSGTSWRLVDLNLDQEPVLPETEITLHIAGSQINGSAGCNSYSSLVTGEEDSPQVFVVGPLTTERKLCSDPISNQESTYLTRLASVVSWRYDFGDLSLSYKLDDNTYGELLFAP